MLFSFGAGHPHSAAPPNDVTRASARVRRFPHHPPPWRRYTGSMNRIAPFLGVARAPFLLLPVALVTCGTGAAAAGDSLSWFRAALALTGLIALHMAVNIFNEVHDFETGIDLETRPTPFSGGSGTLPGGALRPRTAKAFGIACSILGAGIGIYFLLVVGTPMIPLIVVGAVLVTAYTPVFARIGLGEVAAGLGLGALPVIGAALVQTESIDSIALVAAVPAFLMTFDLLLLNEFPDETADRRGGRRNLVLMLGRRSAAMVYLLAAVGVPVSLFVSVMLGVLPAPVLFAALPTLLLFKVVPWAVRTPDDTPPIPALAVNVVWNLATNTLLGVILLLTSAAT